MNTLLKVKLFSISRFGNRKEIAHTAVICRMNESGVILAHFFDCFNMPEPSRWGNLFSIEADIAPVYDFNDDDNLQVAEQLDENNPFLMNERDLQWLWNNVNEYRYEFAY